MVLKEGPRRADSLNRIWTLKGNAVKKLRRRTVAATAASDLPFCAMCGASIRVDASTGRCALGHRVTAPVAAVVEAVVPDVTAVIETPFDATTQLSAADDYAADSFIDYNPEPVAPAGDGLYEAFQSANVANGQSVTWDDVVAPTSESGYEDYAAWAEPASGFSALDMDTSELPVASDEGYEPVPAANTESPIAGDLLDELDDAAYARRKAVGTIGATIVVTGALFASVAVLPF